jgi:hypothetical protein
MGGGSGCEDQLPCVPPSQQSRAKGEAGCPARSVVVQQGETLESGADRSVRIPRVGASPPPRRSAESRGVAARDHEADRPAADDVDGPPVGYAGIAHSRSATLLDANVDDPRPRARRRRVGRCEGPAPALLEGPLLASFVPAAPPRQGPLREASGIALPTFSREPPPSPADEPSASLRSSTERSAAISPTSSSGAGRRSRPDLQDFGAGSDFSDVTAAARPRHPPPRLPIRASSWLAGPTRLTTNRSCSASS